MVLEAAAAGLISYSSCFSFRLPQCGSFRVGSKAIEKRLQNLGAANPVVGFLPAGSWGAISI